MQQGSLQGLAAKEGFLKQHQGIFLTRSDQVTKEVEIPENIFVAICLGSCHIPKEGECMLGSIWLRIYTGQIFFVEENLWIQFEGTCTLPDFARRSELLVFNLPEWTYKALLSREFSYSSIACRRRKSWACLDGGWGGNCDVCKWTLLPPPIHQRGVSGTGIGTLITNEFSYPRPSWLGRGLLAILWICLPYGHSHHPNSPSWPSPSSILQIQKEKVLKVKPCALLHQKCLEDLAHLTMEYEKVSIQRDFSLIKSNRWLGPRNLNGHLICSKRN